MRCNSDDTKKILFTACDMTNITFYHVSEKKTRVFQCIGHSIKKDCVGSLKLKIYGITY